MKLNYLSIALATALATTLTACGSDSSSNYHQPTVAPINDGGTTKPGDGGTTKPGDGGTTKPGDGGTTKPGDNDTKPGDGGTTKPGDNDTKPGDNDTKPGDNDTKPSPGDNPTVNPGDAANPGTVGTDNYVVAQNYIRGAASPFDRARNPEKIGNASAIGFNELNNPYMSNIILARVTDGTKVTNIYTGETPEEVSNNAYDNNGTITNLELEAASTPNNQGALQELNDTDFSTSLTYESKSTGVSDNGGNFYLAGLVRAYDGDDNKSFTVRGQENPVFTIEKGVFKVTNVTGSIGTNTNKEDDVRIFGSLSHANDMPMHAWNASTQKFEDNAGYDKVNKTQNSWQFDVPARNATIKMAAASSSAPSLEDAIEPSELHLDFVQYGRVTAQANETVIGALTKAYNEGNKFYRFNTVSKLNETDNTPVTTFNATDNTIDYYYARGLQPTVKMPTEGKVNYLGHALTYGVDNSFHGGNDKNNTNTAVLTPRDSVGNFVEATLDTATKKVTGSIYNVWTVDAGAVSKGVVQDNLINFTGDVQGNTNSVIGTAKLAYTPAVGTPTDASFRAGFFGAGANELAGNINTTTTGYADTAWGAVFGAKDTKAIPALPVENSVEAKQ